MTEEERKLRERKRLTSKGLIAFQPSGAHPHEILIPFQQHLYLFDARTCKTTNLTAGSAFENVGAPSYPLLSPDGERLAFVRAGDIFIIELQRGAAATGESAAAVTGDAAAASSSSSSPSSSQQHAAVTAFSEWRLTFTGTSVNPASVNGIADFIAQEELGRFRGMWFAPDSRALLFQHTDSSPMEQLSILDLARPSEPASQNPYPRPGKANAKVRLGLLQLQRPATAASAATTDGDAEAEADQPDKKKRRRTPSAKKKATGAAAAAASEPSTPLLAVESAPEPVWLQWDSETYPYVANVVWSAGAPLSIVLQNRLQNVMSLVVVDDLTKGATRELVQEREEPGAGWVNIDHSVPYWLGCGRASSSSSSSSASSSAAAAATSSSSDVAGSSARHFLWSSEHPSGFLALTLHDRSGKRLRVLHDAETVMYRTTVISSCVQWTTSKAEVDQQWELDCNCC
jgi:dipeptidyl-peptidase-4